MLFARDPSAGDERDGAPAEAGARRRPGEGDYGAWRCQLPLEPTLQSIWRDDPSARSMTVGRAIVPGAPGDQVKPSFTVHGSDRMLLPSGAHSMSAPSVAGPTPTDVSAPVATS